MKDLNSALKKLSARSTDWDKLGKNGLTAGQVFRSSRATAEQIAELDSSRWILRPVYVPRDSNGKELRVHPKIAQVNGRKIVLTSKDNKQRKINAGVVFATPEYVREEKHYIPELTETCERTEVGRFSGGRLRAHGTLEYRDKPGTKPRKKGKLKVEVIRRK